MLTKPEKAEYDRLRRLAIGDKLRAQQHERYRTHGALIRERNRAWGAANRAKKNAGTRSWYRANARRLKAKALIYQREHPEYRIRHKARKRGAMGSYTRQEWLAKCALLGNVCFYCGEAKPLTVDHKLPLSRGGSNRIENIIPACLSCNCSKSDKTAREFVGLDKHVDLLGRPGVRRHDLCGNEAAV